MLKLCSCCSQPAQYSLGCVLSSVGISRRVQKCSRVVLFCDACLQALCASELMSSAELRKAVNNAYTQLNLRSRANSNAANEASD
jgi:hypothetical protein